MRSLPTNSLRAIVQTANCSLYEIDDRLSGEPLRVRRLVASTPETRKICNDPFVCGVNYTESLKRANANILRLLKAKQLFDGREEETAIIHILRGGLNFGLREATAEAFGWNAHASAFVSAQRARKSDNPEEWYITESSYQKVYLPRRTQLVFGDVVATGTSLEYTLRHLLKLVGEQKVEITSMLFFTIGGDRAEKLLATIDQLCQERFPSYAGATVVYLEGRFTMAVASSKPTIKYTETDLLRCDAVLAPEFVESQFENPAYPLERCTIYDAGSRAFWLPEYFEDVRDYWEKTAELAANGMDFKGLIAERFPEIASDRFGEVQLSEICRSQLAKCPPAEVHAQPSSPAELDRQNLDQ